MGFFPALAPYRLQSSRDSTVGQRPLNTTEHDSTWQEASSPLPLLHIPVPSHTSIAPCMDAAPSLQNKQAPSSVPGDRLDHREGLQGDGMKAKHEEARVGMEQRSQVTGSLPIWLCTLPPQNSLNMGSQFEIV